MNATDPHREKRHPIQVVAQRSGLSQDVLRAWERRYEAVVPARSEGGQRLYSDDDIERLRLLKRVTDAGRRISDVAALRREELAAIALEDRAEAAPAPTPPLVDPIAMVDSLDAIARLDGVRLQSILHRQLLTAGSLNLIEGLVAPLMVEIGRLWHEGRLGASHEHLATEVLRGLVARVLADAQPVAPRGTIVVATTAQQRHEVGGLMAAATAAQEGWRVVYLGSDLPAPEIVSACRRVGADALGLSFSYRNESVDDLAEIASVVRGLGPEVRVLVGGAAANAHAERLGALGAEVVADLAALRSALALG